MNFRIGFGSRAGVVGLVLGLTGCAATGPAASSTGSGTATTIEAALPLVRTGAAVATGAVLDFAVKQAGTRTRLANEMYGAANAVYSLSGGTYPAPAQFEATILAFGGSQADANYAQFSTAIAGLYAAYYPKLASGDGKTGADLLEAIAGGIEDGARAYVTTPAVTGNVGILDGINGIDGIFCGGSGGSEAARTSAFPSATWERGGAEEGSNGVAQTIAFPGEAGGGEGGSNGVARTSAFPNGVWERGELQKVSF